MKDFKQAVQEVIDGNADPLEVYAALNLELKELETCKKQIEDYAKEEAEKHGSKFEHKGYKFEVRQGGRSYSFKNIKAWSDKQKEIKEIEERYKSAFSSYEKGLMTADENGEEMELPEVSYRSNSLIIKKL
ncbi:MAG: hypothetical protein KDC67_15275 [Ignavibacteriae bacterium]|nr:hypothetical protein [Ignavibacteriota bacterium]